MAAASKSSRLGRRRWADLCSELPRLANDIGALLVGERTLRLPLDYPALDTGAQPAALLELAFGWNLDLYLCLWDVEWAEADITAQFREAADLAAESGDAFSAWIVGMMALQLSQAGLEELGDVIEPLLEAAFATKTATTGAAATALALSRLGHIDRALVMLQPLLRDDAPATIWNAAIDIALDAGRPADAVDICQTALESGLEQAALYQKYAELLTLAEANDWAIEDVLLIDPDESDESEHVAHEIANARKRATQLAPDLLPPLQMALSAMIDTGDPDMWDYFAALVERDGDAEYISDMIEQLADVDDLAPGFEILRAHVEQAGSGAYARVHLAQLCIVAEDYAAAAAEELRICRETSGTIDDQLELELQRLELTAAQPDFEARFAEIKVLLSANRTPGESEIDTLEAAIAIAPRLVDLHLLLSRCYASWGDAESALEVLQEAGQSAGQHPRISQSLGQLQWRGRQRDAAVATLNRGLELFPSDVGLLSQMAACLIENGQLDDARRYIERAESIAPSHQAVWQLRRLIAEKLSR